MAAEGMPLGAGGRRLYPAPKVECRVFATSGLQLERCTATQPGDTPFELEAPGHAVLHLNLAAQRVHLAEMDGARVARPTVPGTVTLVPPGCILRGVLRGRVLNRYALLFIARARLDRLRQDWPGAPAGPSPLLLAWSERLHLLMGLMLREAEAGDALAFDTLGVAVMGEVLRAPLPPPVRGLAPWRLARVDAYARAHLAGPVTLADLAREAGYSVHHFCRAFRAATGLPPHRWLTGLRMDHAKALLRSGATVAAVARQCGFGSQSHFAALFRRGTGLSPAQWQRGASPNPPN